MSAFRAARYIRTGVSGNVGDTARPSRRGVALGGFMGAGKSSVGRALAARLALPFVDVDDVLTAAHGPIPEQIGADEAAFRRRERDAIAALCDGTPRVVATGGGAWVDPANRAVLGRDHDLVVLRASLATLRARVGAGDGRPLWARAEALLAARALAYAHADLVVDTDGLDVDGVVEEVLRWRSR